MIVWQSGCQSNDASLPVRPPMFGYDPPSDVSRDLALDAMVGVEAVTAAADGNRIVLKGRGLGELFLGRPACKRVRPAPPKG
jgi:hypothetical protein